MALQGQKVEDGSSSCDEDEENDSHLVAQIPWIKWKKSVRKLEDIKYFQEVAIAGKEGKTRIELYRILNDIFPFYLPKR